MTVTASTRNLRLSGSYSDPVVHAPSAADPSRPRCGRGRGSGFRPTLDRVTCQRCGVTAHGLDEFVSWDSAAKAEAGYPHVVGKVEDSGDSITIRTEVRDFPGAEVSLDFRIKPEDLDRFIARLTEIKEARGL